MFVSKGGTSRRGTGRHMHKFIRLLHVYFMVCLLGLFHTHPLYHFIHAPCTICVYAVSNNKDMQHLLFANANTGTRVQ